MFTMPRSLTIRIFALAALPALACAAHAQTPDGRANFDQGYIDFLFSPTHPGAVAPRRSVERHAEGDRSTRQRVPYQTSEPIGTILIDTASRRLYLVEPNGFAQRYDVGVGKEGYGWHGTERVSAKREWPDWRPPAAMLARRPDLPRHIAGGPDNPLGARALYLGDTLYRIHGSNEPETVGTAASSGCFRMTNTDVIDLYQRVGIGAKVRVF
jgi:lipoprotein-anchoring transpeptidase ErfK/SrfK